MTKWISASLLFTLLSSNAFARGSLAHVEWGTIVALIFGGMVASIAAFLGSSSSKDKSNAALWALGFGLLLVVIGLFTATPEFGFLLVALCVAYFYYKRSNNKRLTTDKDSDIQPHASHQNFKNTHEMKNGTSKLNHGWGQINRRPKSTLEDSSSINSPKTIDQGQTIQSPAAIDSWPYVQQEKVSNRDENQEALRDLLIAQMKRNSISKNSNERPDSSD